MHIHIPLSLSLYCGTLWVFLAWNYPCLWQIPKVLWFHGFARPTFLGQQFERRSVLGSIHPLWTSLDISGHLWTNLCGSVMFYPIVGWAWLSMVDPVDSFMSLWWAPDSWHELVKPPQVSYQGQRQGQFPGEVARACGGSLRGMPSPTDRLRDLRCLKKSAGQRGVNSVVFLKNSRKWSQF